MAARQQSFTLRVTMFPLDKKMWPHSQHTPMREIRRHDDRDYDRDDDHQQTQH